LFAKEILPRLEHELGPEGFEVHVVGEGEPPLELARVLPRPSVKLRGRIEPADSEFLSADIQLVPTPFVLGIRLRVIVGFSFGCCVVAHTNEAVNLPEMVNGKNALLASNGKGLAEAIIRAVRDPAMRNRLGLNARQTYEYYFAPKVAAAPIVTELERLSHERRPSQSEAERPLF
jgi:glycosyltransferase involved in cell wall biosynthesis